MFGRKGLNQGEGRASPPASAIPSPQTELKTTFAPAPLAIVAKYVGCVSPGSPPFFVEELFEWYPCKGPGDARGLCFRFSGGNAQGGKAYFFPNFASIWVDGEPGPRAQVPTDMIVDAVPGYLEALQASIAGVERQRIAIREATTR